MKVTGLLWWKTTRIKTISVSVLLCIFLAITSCIYSCQNGEALKVNPFLGEPGNSKDINAVGEGVEALDNSYMDDAGSSIYSFDYDNIKIRSAQVMGMEIRNCNLYMDSFGDLIILGEVINSDGRGKTDAEITFEFVGADGRIIDTKYVESYADYIQPKKRIPFYLVYSNVDNYMDISVVKIGVNYNSYNEEFEGFPIVSGQNFYYEGKTLIIEGDIENIGQANIEDIRLFGTFYDLRDRVVFIREGFLQQRKLSIFEKQKFQMRVFLDDYIKNFTHYRIGVFFRDSFKVKEI